MLSLKPKLMDPCGISSLFTTTERKRSTKNCASNFKPNLHPSLSAKALLYPVEGSGSALINHLLNGDGTPANRRSLIYALIHSSIPKEVWLASWITLHPEEVRSLALGIALTGGSSSPLPNAREPETPFSLFLDREPWEPSQPTTLARLAMIRRFHDAKPLLDYLSTAPCHDLPAPILERGSLTPDLINTLIKKDPLALVLLPARSSMSHHPLLEALQANPSFKILSNAGQARYFLFAHLNRPLLNTLTKVDWSSEATTPLAFAAGHSLNAEKWARPDKLLKAQWLNKFITSKNATTLPQHLEWWAWQLEEIKLDNHDLEILVNEVAEKITAQLNLVPGKALELLVSSIRCSFTVPFAIARIRGEIAPPLEHPTNTLRHDQLLGSLLLNASSLPLLPNARGENYRGPWTGNLSTEYRITSNHYRTLRHLNWIKIRNRNQLAGITQEDRLILAKNLRNHLILPDTPGTKTFIVDWVQYLLSLGEDKYHYHPFLLQWSGQSDSGISMGKALINQNQETPPAKLRGFFDTYPPAFLQTTLNSSRNTGFFRYSAPALTEINRRLVESKFTGQRSPRPTIPLHIQKHKAISRTEVTKFFNDRLLSGKSLEELSSSFQIFRQFSSLNDLGNLLRSLGETAARTSPDWKQDDWYDEVMTYLETISPHELWEGGSQLPMAQQLATHPKFAERYFNWVSKAGGSIFQRCGSIAGDLFEKDDPILDQWGYRWLEEALAYHSDDLLINDLYTSSFRLSSSSSPNNLWTKLGKSGKLTPFADRIFPRLNRDINAHLTLLLLASSSKPAAYQELHQRLRIQKLHAGHQWRSDSFLRSIQWTLQAFPDGIRRYSQIQKALLNDPELASGTDLPSLLQTDQGIPIDETILRAWNATVPSRIIYKDSRILGIALVEASDETFQAILSDFAGLEDTLDKTSVWKDILWNHHFADPARLRSLLDHLLVKGRLAKLREQRWTEFVPQLLHALNRSSHRKLLSALEPEWTRHLYQAPKHTSSINESDTHRFALYLDKPTPPRPVLSLAKSIDGKPLVVWSLIGGSKIEGVVFESSIKPYDGLYDLTLFQRPDQGPPVEIATIKAAKTQGHFTVPPAQLKLGSRWYLRATPAGDPGNSHWDSPNITIAPDHPSTTSLENRWNFAKTNERGPFDIRQAWRGRFNGNDVTNRILELNQWDAKATPNLSLSFWLNQGARKNIKATLDFLDERGTVLKEIILKSSTGGHIARGGWQEVVYLQSDHQIPKNTTHLSLRIKRYGAAFYLTQPEYSVD